MRPLVNFHGALYLVDKDHDKHCSIYTYIDYWQSNWLSFVFCDSCNPHRARKSIRLEPGAPVAVKQRPGVFAKTSYWEINSDGSDQILLEMLRRKNSIYPLHTNWERLQILYDRHAIGGFKRLKNPELRYRQIPDYAHLWGICNWDAYGDMDPDHTCPIVVDEKNNISIYTTSGTEGDGAAGLLIYDDFIRDRAKRVAKISLLEPVYLDYTPNDYVCTKELWRLPAKVKQVVNKAVRGKDKYAGTIWRKIIWESSLLDGEWPAGENMYISHPFLDKLPIIPDYTLLPE